VQTLNKLSQVRRLNGPLGVYSNHTLNYNELDTAHAIDSARRDYVNQLSVVVSASSDDDVHVYGVKSDKGTTDGFMALPLTEQSTEFFVAAWK